MKKKILFLTILTLALTAIPAVSAQDTYKITLKLDNIPDVSPSHLEGWVIKGDDKYSFGVIDADDMMMDSMGGMSYMLEMDISDADVIAITIEPEGDMDDVPSGIVLISGEVHDGSAELEFPVSFDDATGTYILATPSNGADTDENSGIWFLELPDPSPGLSLPMLPSGWVYEGWVVYEGTPITSGRFTDVAAVDMFDGYSASTTYPPFPGEDYLINPPAELTFPIDLGDGMSKAVISVEPDLMGVDPTGDGPFAIKPLVGDIPAMAMDHVNYDMSLTMAPLPTGLAVIGMDSGMVMETMEMLEAQIESLQEEITSLENEITDLEATVADLEMMETPMAPLGSWQAISAVALIVGLAVGAAVINTRK